MEDSTFIETLKKLNKKQTAKFPVATSVLRQIPFFCEIFSENEEVLKALSQLVDLNKVAYIRYKTFESKEIIVRQGDIENTVYWLLKGSAKIRSGNRILAQIKPVTCFGELTVAASQGRTATVEADESAEVVEIDWSITQRDSGLRDRFLELLFISTADKLKTVYTVSDKMWQGARNLYSSCKKRVKELEIENEQLKEQINTLRQKLDQ